MQVFPTDAQHSRKLISGFHMCKFNSILTEIDSVILFDLKLYNELSQNNIIEHCVVKNITLMF